ncbi:MAG: hypothetical protein ABIS50_13940 [Luteolibacter sp.]|uniref:hypothetical protein n=1 Tax=Luteolibacter sp. TaxID=1962973 RepID=UPI0032661440
MKIDPGFLNHWKTERLLDQLGSAGVVAVLRLWGSAQIRRKFSGLDFTPKRLAMETKWKGDPDELFAVLTDRDAPWLDADPDGTFTIHGFDEHQRQVVRLWSLNPEGRGSSKPSPSSSPSSYPISEPNGNHMVPMGLAEESDLDGYEAIPTGNKPRLLDLERKVQGLRKEWRLPFIYTEQQALLGSARCLDALSEEGWLTLRDYLYAKIPQGVPSWQPRQRLKFLETCSDVAAHADTWKRHQSDRSAAPIRLVPPPEQSDEDKEALNEFLSKRSKP